MGNDKGDAPGHVNEWPVGPKTHSPRRADDSPMQLYQNSSALPC